MKVTEDLYSLLSPSTRAPVIRSCHHLLRQPLWELQRSVWWIVSSIADSESQQMQRCQKRADEILTSRLYFLAISYCSHDQYNNFSLVCLYYPEKLKESQAQASSFYLASPWRVFPARSNRGCLSHSYSRLKQRDRCILPLLSGSVKGINSTDFASRLNFSHCNPVHQHFFFFFLPQMVIYVTLLEIAAVFQSNRKMGYICTAWGKIQMN